MEVRPGPVEGIIAIVKWFNGGEESPDGALFGADSECFFFGGRRIGTLSGAPRADLFTNKIIATVGECRQPVLCSFAGRVVSLAPGSPL